jgi:ubiquinone/menaquinone biosynthesis C-methylase UbiE
MGPSPIYRVEPPSEFVLHSHKGIRMFSETAQYYDLIYSQKDYQAEVEKLLAFIGEHRSSNGDRLLEVACGTGHHIYYLKEHFSVEGMDLDPKLLEIACKRNPKITFTEGDMIDFDLGRQFDIITCLFSSIGYVKTHENLDKTIYSMMRHLTPGGLLLIEPWFTPQDWRPGTLHALVIDEPELKIVRMNLSQSEGNLSYFDFHYLIGTLEGVEHITERHELGLFKKEEMEAAFTDAGLLVLFDEEGLTGRGLYIGKKPD